MHDTRRKRNIALLILGTGILMFILMLVFVLPYFMSEKKFGEMQAALNEGDYNRVIKTAEFLISQNPDTVQAYYFRGQAYIAQKKYTLAEKDLEKVIKLNVQYSNMRSVGVQLGEVYHKHGLTVINTQPDKARRLFLKGLKYLPREINLKRDMALSSYYVGQAVEGRDKGKAVTFYREAINHDPENPQYKLALGRNLTDSNNIEEAIALMTSAFQQDESLKNTHNIDVLIGNLWRLAISKERDYFSGKITDAKVITSLFDNILNLDNDNKQALLEWFSFAINIGNYEEAARVLDDIADKNILLPLDNLDSLLQKAKITKPTVIFTGGSDTDVELKLDSELAWSSDGQKIIVKAMDKSTTKTRVFVYDLTSNSSQILQNSEKIAWEGRVFSLSADGILISSENEIFKVAEDFASLEKVLSTEGKVLDFTRDGKGALIADHGRLYRMDLASGKKQSIANGRIKGNMTMGVYSPQNKRIAIVAGQKDKEKVGVVTGRNRLTILGEANSVLSLKWSWDGKKIFYLNTGKGLNSVFSVLADGRGEPQPIIKPEYKATIFEPSPVDEFIIYKGVSGKESLWLADDTGTVKALTPRFGEFGKLVWSPDGSKAVYLFTPVSGGPISLEIVDVLRF